MVLRSSIMQHMLLSESMLKCYSQRGFDAFEIEVAIQRTAPARLRREPGCGEPALAAPAVMTAAAGGSMPTQKILNLLVGRRTKLRRDDGRTKPRHYEYVVVIRVSPFVIVIVSASGSVRGRASRTVVRGPCLCKKKERKQATQGRDGRARG